MELHTFAFTELHHHGACFTGYLGLRKRLFVDNLGWQLSHDGQHEMDQYDHPMAVYSIVTVDGRVVAGGRALSCASKWLGWSYMLNDARRRMISFIPSDLMAEYPQDASVWECTRLVMDEGSLSSAQRATALKAVVFGLCRVVEERGGHDLLSLSPVSMGRMLRSFGYDAQACGRRYQGVEDGRNYQPFMMSCDTSVGRGISGKLGSGTPNDQLLSRLLDRAA